MKKGSSGLLVLIFLFAALSGKAQLLDSAALSLEPVFESMEEALKEPDKVIRLHLIKQKLTEVPKEVYLFKNLQELDLSKNRIKELPDTIATLTNLQTFNLSKNNLELLPAAIGKLSNLKKLIVNQNSLTALPTAIGDLSNLLVLDLWSNDISFFPDSLADLKKLRYMDLQVILINGDEQRRIQDLLPNTLIKFSPDCHCSGG